MNLSGSSGYGYFFVVPFISCWLLFRDLDQQMAKKKGSKKGKKKGSKNAADVAKEKAEKRKARLARLGKVGRKGSTMWGTPICLPIQPALPTCQCMQLTMSNGGNYDPQACSLHSHENLEHLSRYNPVVTYNTIGRAYERQHGVGSEHGVSKDLDGGAIRSVLLQREREPVRQVDLDFMIQEYLQLLNNRHGVALPDSQKAEVLTRLGSLLLALRHPKNQEALTASEIAIGLRPSLSSAYFISGQAYFNLKMYEKAVDRFRAGLKEDPNRKELQEAYKKSILEVNVARRRDPVRRPTLIPTTTMTRDDLVKPTWMKLKILLKTPREEGTVDSKKKPKSGEVLENRVHV